jgi:hypothetical protein
VNWPEGLIEPIAVSRGYSYVQITLEDRRVRVR